jgi:hypothetical protein
VNVEILPLCESQLTVKQDRSKGGPYFLVVICLGLEDDFSQGTSNPHILSSCLAA